MKNKKKSRKKSNRDIRLIDVSQRKYLNMISDEKMFEGEELQNLITELNAQIKQLELLEKRYYSNNAYIERISKRSLWDILCEKMENLALKKTL